MSWGFLSFKTVEKAWTSLAKRGAEVQRAEVTTELEARQQQSGLFLRLMSRATSPPSFILSPRQTHPLPPQAATVPISATGKASQIPESSQRLGGLGPAAEGSGLPFTISRVRAP